MAIYCILCEIQQVIGPESGNFYATPVFSAVAEGDPVGILR